MVDPFQGKPGFQGSLTIGGVLQAQGQGSKKKEAKQKTYDIAFERFTKLDVTEVMKGVEPQVCVWGCVGGVCMRACVCANVCVQVCVHVCVCTPVLLEAILGTFYINKCSRSQNPWFKLSVSMPSGTLYE